MLLERLDDGYVLVLVREARLAPFQLFHEPAMLQYRAKFLDFTTPGLRAAHKFIDLGIVRVHGHCRIDRTRCVRTGSASGYPNDVTVVHCSLHPTKLGDALSPDSGNP